MPQKTYEFAVFFDFEKRKKQIKTKCGKRCNWHDFISPFMYGVFPRSHKPDFSSGKKKKNKTKIALTAKNHIFMTIVLLRMCVLLYDASIFICVFLSRTIRCALVWLVNGIRRCFVMNCHHSSLSNGFNKTKRKILTELNRIGKMRWKIKLEFFFGKEVFHR